MVKAVYLSWLFVAAIVGNLFLPQIAAMKAMKEHHESEANPKKLMSFNRQDYELERNDVGGLESSGASTSNKSSAMSAFSKLSQAAQQKQDSPFSWRNVITMALQFVYKLLNPSNGLDKSGDGPILKDGEFSWSRLLSLAVKIALAGLGADPSGLDRSDHSGPVSPMEGMLTAALSILMSSSDPKEVTVMAKQAGELISLGVSLLDALKTSFSRRSLEARSLGDNDRFSDAAVATLALLKGYAQTYQHKDDTCRQKAMCLANQACAVDAPSVNVMWCKVGSYLMSVGIMTGTSDASFGDFNDAARRGRLLEDCDTLYECNEVY